MSRKAFILTSAQYCDDCGCFDMVRKQRSWFSRFILMRKAFFKCYGCGSCFSEKGMVNMIVRPMPTNINNFFFQTTLRNRELSQKQLKPMTEFLGACLILLSVVGLFKLPFTALSTDHPPIEWSSLANKVSSLHQAAIVKELKFEFDELLEEAKKIPASYKTGQ